ncbi:MAG TPA: GNAT family N-acetyltransferase [Jatrophihabitans sp.]|nr:GNAT family N-acetyltransferase [Jatrophihabitans sp.]
MPDRIELRPRSAADLPACVAALREVHERDGYPQRWPVDPPGWLDPPGLAGAWVAVADGAVHGHVALVADGADALVLSRLYVAAAARGTGLAGRLLDLAVTQAGARSLWLEVMDDAAPAIRLYERAGWHLVERRPASWVGPAGRSTVRVYRAVSAYPHGRSGSG